MYISSKMNTSYSQKSYNKLLNKYMGIKCNLCGVSSRYLFYPTLKLNNTRKVK